MKTIVFLARKFLPNADATGVCTYNVAKEFLNDGFNVICICEGIGGSETIEGIKVVRVKPTLYMRLRDPSYIKKNNAMKKLFVRIYGLIRKLYLMVTFFTYPAISPIRTRKILKQLNIIESKTHIDYLIAGHVPYDNIQAVTKFKKSHHDSLTYLCYWDILRGVNPFGKRLYGLFDKLCYQSEKKDFKINDRILLPVNSKTFYTKKTYDFARSKIRYFDFPLFVPYIETKDKIEFEKDKLNMVFAGTIDGLNRSISYLLEIFKQLKARTHRDICIHIFGKLDDKTLSSLDTEIVHYYGMVPYDEVQKYIGGADILINIGNKITYKMVPSKIFQLFASGKKIINIVRTKEDCSIEYFEKYPFVCNINEYIADIEHDVVKLSEFIDSQQSSRESTIAEIEKIYYRSKPSYIKNIVLNEQYGQNK